MFDDNMGKGPLPLWLSPAVTDRYRPTETTKQHGQVSEYVWLQLLSSSPSNDGSAMTNSTESHARQCLKSQDMRVFFTPSSVNNAFGNSNTVLVPVHGTTCSFVRNAVHVKSKIRTLVPPPDPWLLHIPSAALQQDPAAEGGGEATDRSRPAARTEERRSRNEERSI